MIGLDVILGGLTGLIGNALTSFMNYKSIKLEHEHEEKMVEIETAAMKEEAKMQIEIKKAEIEGEVELADANAYLQGQIVGNKETFSSEWIDRLFSVTGWLRYLSIPLATIIACAFAFVDFLRGFMRPAITLYLTGMTTVITWMAWDIMQKHDLQLSPQEAMGIYEQVTSIVIYLTVSCVTWWFADRRTAKFLQNMKKGKINNEGI